jgi:hypothetical protein
VVQNFLAGRDVTAENSLDDSIVPAKRGGGEEVSPESCGMVILVVKCDGLG